MLLYRSPATDAMWAGLQADPSDAPERWDEPEDVGASVGVVALRPGQVYQPGASGAWLAGATGPVTAGEPMVFYRPVAAVPVRRRRNGAVLAAGWLPEHVRLGVLEALLPAGLVDWLVRQVSGVRETQRRRVMNAALVVRFVLALVLWPEADYVEVMRRLVGDLPALPWQRPWQVPSSRVISQWRTRVPATLFEQLFWAVAGPLAGAREPGLYVNGLLVCALDAFHGRPARHRGQPGLLHPRQGQAGLWPVPAATGGGPGGLRHPRRPGRGGGPAPPRRAEPDPPPGQDPSAGVRARPACHHGPQLPRLQAHPRHPHPGRPRAHPHQGRDQAPGPPRATRRVLAGHPHRPPQRSHPGAAGGRVQRHRPRPRRGVRDVHPGHQPARPHRVDPLPISSHELGEAVRDVVEAECLTYRRSKPPAAGAAGRAITASSPVGEDEAAWWGLTGAELLGLSLAGQGSSRTALVGDTGIEPVTPTVSR